MSQTNAVARSDARPAPWTISDDGGGQIVRFNPQVITTHNFLAPFVEVRQLDRNYSPIVKEVWLKPHVDTYSERNAGGKHAVTAKGLQKLADAAGITFDPTVTDWMQGMGVSVTGTGRRRGPDGVWISRSAVKTEWFSELAERVKAESKNKSAEALAKRVRDERQHLHAKLETKAWNRVVRALISLPAALPEGDYNKPFLIVSWAFTPAYDEPGVQELIRINAGAATSALYGGRPQLAAVPDPQPDEPVQHQRLADDDEPAELASPPVDAVPVEPGPNDLVVGPPEDFNTVGKPTQPAAFGPEGNREDLATLAESEEGRARLAEIGRVSGRFDVAAAWISWGIQEHVGPDEVAQYEKRVSA